MEGTDEAEACGVSVLKNGGRTERIKEVTWWRGLIQVDPKFLYFLEELEECILLGMYRLRAQQMVTLIILKAGVELSDPVGGGR